ncbi:hypothetical protein ACG2LH_03830 [Zhouia sp. PK063]|uniref:hypothetical protein n=1 Tax=Zhouia sp. PK063 TaxID=3373602 RepID=UPI0037AAEF26
MKNYYTIEIPNPCIEDWSKMHPTTHGKHCDVCCKQVVDFTKYTHAEIQDYFSLHANEKVCGRFLKNQLSTTRISIPESVFHQKYSFRKAFLLALLFAMGTSLFSCTTTTNTTTKIDKVEMVNDSVDDANVLGFILPPSAPPPPPALIQPLDSLNTKEQEKEVVVITIGEVEIIPELEEKEDTTAVYISKTYAKLKPPKTAQ